MQMLRSKGKCIRRMYVLRRISKSVEIDKEFLLDWMDGILSKVFIDQIWNMIYGRYQIYEKL